MSDNDPNPNGVFTREFITQIQKPGVRIEDIMRSVQDSVETLAKSVSHEQRPAVYNEARGNFYFFGPTTVQVVKPAASKPDSNALELALWDSAKTATTIAEVQAYLNRFPHGFFAEMASARIVALESINAEKFAAENNLRLAEEARVKEQQRLALEAQKQEQVRLAQEAKQKEQERLIAEQRIKEQERVAGLNVQKLADERAKEEAERKVALERAAQELGKNRMNSLAPISSNTSVGNNSTNFNQNKPDKFNTYYRVEVGDTLNSIAIKHRLTWRDIAKWNSLDNPVVIEVGQLLRVTPP